MTTLQIIVALNEERYELNGYLLGAALLTAIATGAVCGWYRSYSLDNVWQRGVIAVLAAIGAMLVGIVAAPINRFGVGGMLVWLLLNIALGILATRWAIKGKGEEGSGMSTP